MYEVTTKFDEEDKYSYRTVMTITDDSGTREQHDRGGPEDNSFLRDWAWVKDELLKAYEQGKRDGANELELLS